MALFSKKMNAWVFSRDIAVFASIYLAGIVYLPRGIFLALLNGVLASMCFAVCVVFAPSFAELWRKGSTGIIIMRAAIVGAWADQMIQAIARIYFLEFHPEVQGRTFDVTLGLPAVGYIIFAAMHLISIGMLDGNTLVRRNMCVVAWAAIGGILATFALIVLHRMM